MTSEEKIKNERIKAIEDIDAIANLVSKFYKDTLPVDVTMNIATQIFMNEEKNYRHDVEQGNLGYMFGASIN